MRETVLNVYCFVSKEVQKAEVQVPEHCRKQLLKVQNWVEQAAEVSGKTIRRILGEQRKHKRKVLYSLCLQRHAECLIM